MAWPKGKPRKNLGQESVSVAEEPIQDPAAAAHSVYRSRREAEAKFLAASKKSVRVIGFEAHPHTRKAHRGFSELRILAKSELREIVYSRIIQARWPTKDAIRLAGLDPESAAAEAKKLNWVF